MAINLKKTKQAEAIEHIKRAYKNSLDFQRPLFVKFNEYYQIYRAIREDGKQNYAGRAKLYIPYVFATIESIVPRLVGSKPKIEAIPREPNDILNARMNTSLFNYEWDEMGMKEILKLWVKQTLIYGTGILKLSWRFRGEEEDIRMDKPQAELVDLFDFYIDPNATSITDADYIVHRTERSLDDLKNNANYTIPKELVNTVNKDEYKVQRDAILGLAKPQEAKKVEILEYWGNYDLNGDGTEEECLLVVANQQYLIRAEANPYEHKQKPFIAMIDVQIPHSFWGVGEVEQLKSLQYELNDIRNQRMDNVTLILNRMWKVLKGQVDEEDLVSQAGQTIHVDDMNALEPLETQDVTTSAYNEESLVKADMQLVSGINDYNNGVGGNPQKGNPGMGNDTATGIMLLQEAGNARFKYKLDNIEDSLICFGKQLLALNQQFLDYQTKLRIVGEGGMRFEDFSPDDIIGNFDVTVTAGSTQPMNKSVRRAEARQLVESLIPFIPMGINIRPILEYYLETYDVIDIDEVFPQEQINPMLGLPQEAAGPVQPGIAAGNTINPAGPAPAGMLGGAQGAGQPANILARANVG